MKANALVPGSLLLALLLGTAAPLAADEILLTNGERIEDVTIVKEGITLVTYSRDRVENTVPSSDVRGVGFERYPEDVDTALGFRREGDLYSALQYLDSYVDGQIKRLSERKFPWAPAFAAWTALELRMQLADLEEAKTAAQRVIDNFGDTRYAPHAYLIKADAERRTGYHGDAVDTLDALAELASSVSLSKRWELECRLSRIVTVGSRVPAERREVMAAIAQEAGSSHPVVRLRAETAQASSMLAEAEGTVDANAADSLRAEAERLLTAVVADPVANEVTLAEAHTGLGDCGFYRGAATEDREVLQQAALHYLRVVTMHPTASEFVPKCLFYAMRCFQILGQRTRRADMARELLDLYPDSEWAKRPEVSR